MPEPNIAEETKAAKSAGSKVWRGWKRFMLRNVLGLPYGHQPVIHYRCCWNYEVQNDLKGLGTGDC